MKNKKIITSLLLVAVVGSTFLSACSQKPKNPDDKYTSAEIDKTKTQLYIGNYNGGYGDSWLKAAAKRFEEYYAEESFETDKKGVEIRIDNKKEEFTSVATLESSMDKSNNSLYFTEKIDYDMLVSHGYLADISDVVGEKLTKFGEDKSVLDKYTPQQKGYYTTADGKCYAVPHYSAYMGIVYDIDLFEDYLLYFSGESENDDGFILSKTDKKSNGPDGKTGVIDGIDYSLDDGLPATYEEFYKLCDRMIDMTLTPFIWSGQHHDGYLRSFLSALAVDYAGYDEALVNYSFNGKIKTITGFNGTTPVFGEENITPRNGYKLYSQAGLYYSMKPLEYVVKKGYYHNLSFNVTYSHLNAQEDYLYSKYEATGAKKPVAMLIDGIYWQAEASGSFDNVVEAYGEKASAKNRRFGFMPFPKANAEKVGSGTTLLDELASIAVVNAKATDLRQSLAKKFLQFIYTDESLNEFLAVTGTPKAVDFAVNKTVYDNLTVFSQSVMNLKTTSKIIYAYSENSFWRATHLQLNRAYQSSLNEGNFVDVGKTFKEYSYNAEQYFSGMLNYWTENRWNTDYAGMFN